MNSKQDRESVIKMTLAELQESLEVLRQQLFDKRMAVLSMTSNRTDELRFVRKQIARRVHRIAMLTTSSAEVLAHA
jgi:ribosomal protein L29